MDYFLLTEPSLDEQTAFHVVIKGSLNPPPSHLKDLLISLWLALFRIQTVGMRKGAQEDTPTS